MQKLTEPKKIIFLHPKAKEIEGVRNLLKIDERNLGFEFIIDEKNPDYVFASEHIYYDKTYRTIFYESQKSNPINIFFAGEAIAADLNLFDYAIVFDKHLVCEDRIGRIPLLSYFSLENEILCRERKYDGVGRDKFCCFIYSNPNAHPRRDELFYALSKYKRVDSLGRHLNNTECASDRYSIDWRENSIKIKAGYKFSIAAENAVYRGYTSEKIMTSFLAGGIPIYWGNPLVEEEFNKEAFINANGLSNDELISIVKMIDEDDACYNRMVSQPWLTNEQIGNLERDKRNYYSFLENIFRQDIGDAYRRGDGTAPCLYKRFIIREGAVENQKGWMEKILEKKREFMKFI